MKKIIFFSITVCLFVQVCAAQSGHTNWKGWSFDFNISSARNSGLEITNVYFNGKKVLFRGSLPVIRVQYFAANPCGPYEDRIGPSNVIDFTCSGTGATGKLCQFQFNWGGGQWLEIGTYATIGAYHLYQAWYFSEDGRLHSRMWSKGLHCQQDHEHHPYWRLDFDINGLSGDQAFVKGSSRPNSSWGPGWLKIRNETKMTKIAGYNEVWFCRDNATGNGVWLIPGASDGNAGSWCNEDFNVRLYKGSEDVQWMFGASGNLGYNEFENVEEKDLVMWYTPHLFHHAHEGEDQWHWVGPTIICHQNR
ncbi:MAG: hypothetical protein H7246_22785 [Phycisphaerae bacterium]|nr:hypothetical protein [Saprospiraceae bacterium]